MDKDGGQCKDKKKLSNNAGLSKHVYFKSQRDFIEILTFSAVDMSYELRKLNVLSVIYSFPGNLKIAACASQMYDGLGQNVLRVLNHIFYCFIFTMGNKNK